MKKKEQLALMRQLGDLVFWVDKAPYDREQLMAILHKLQSKVGKK